MAEPRGVSVCQCARSNPRLLRKSHYPVRIFVIAPPIFHAKLDPYYVLILELPSEELLRGTQRELRSTKQLRCVARVSCRDQRE